MGLIDRALGGGSLEGIGNAAEGLSEVFVPNATRALELAAQIQEATLEAASAEFQYAGSGWFDRAINGLNRVPRPMLALGTLALFGYAMTDPVGFAERMVGLNEVPEPLWWLLGAIVSFYFGARELHYARVPGVGRGSAGGASNRRGLRDRLGGVFGRRREAEAEVSDNPALSEWRSAD